MEARIRVADAKDCGEAASMMRRVFGGNHTAPYVRWKYYERPTGHGILVVAEKNGNIIGTWGAVPVYMDHNGSTYRTWFMSDGGVLPQHRRQGIYAAMGSRIMEMMRAQKSAGAWTFATTMARHSLTQRFGMSELGAPRWYWGSPSLARLVLRKLGLLRSGNKQDGIAAPQEFGTDSLHRLEELFARHTERQRDYIRLHKDAEYLKWRYTTHPLFNYQLEQNQSWTAAILTRGRAIVDCACAQPEAVSDVLRRLHDTMLQEGRDDCYLYYQGDNQLVQALRRAGFRSDHNIIARHVERMRVASPRWLLAKAFDGANGLPFMDASRWELFTGDHGEMA